MVSELNSVEIRSAKKEVEEFLSKYGMNYAEIDIQKNVDLFIGEMEAGLSGKKSSLKMFPTYIGFRRVIPANEPVIVLDAGGTNLRSALLHFDDENKSYTCVVKDEAVKRFHPNEIDNKDFWVKSKETFPLLSVCGSEAKSMKQANLITLQFAKKLKFLQMLLKLLSEYEGEDKMNFLEIGFGYGNIFKLMSEYFNYKGIDFTVPPSLKKYSELVEIDVSGIPEELLIENYYDVVYSVNVLQHCSQKDRFTYLEQAYDVLKPDGYLMFSCNLLTSKNANEHHFWGFKDKNGRYYTQFFNQLTEVDTEDELAYKLMDVGFKTVGGTMIGNHVGIIVKK